MTQQQHQHLDTSTPPVVVEEDKKREGKIKADKKTSKNVKTSSSTSTAGCEILLTETYGNLDPLTSSLRARRQWTDVKDLNVNKAEELGDGGTVWIRARLQASRKTSNKLGFLMFRDKLRTIQAVVAADDVGISREMVKWACSTPTESIMDILGSLSIPGEPVRSATQSAVELQVKKIFCVSRASLILPFQLEDANRSETELTADPNLVRVNQDVRLDNRILDLRTRSNQAIFRLQSHVVQLFREFLLEKDFIEIHSPKLLSGASEGGASCFTLKYFEENACLAQSPQLYKQMALSGDLDRVFEIGPVFRAENANTHRHLCEFTGLDMEMTFKDTYEEVLDVIEDMFLFIFQGLNNRAAEEIAAVYDQYPAEQFTVSEDIPRFDFKEGIDMLREAGEEVPDDITELDLSTPLEKALGRLVKSKYGSDFYTLLHYPTKVRPFYSMPSQHDKTFSNSYDLFMRGEEIVSGAQRVHVPELLIERATEAGIPVNTIQSYVDSFTLGAYPHAGCGIGLERVLMLFLGLGNIRKVSLFPRDPKRLTP